MTQDIMEKFLNEIPSKDRGVITYVHLQGIQIVAKAYFKEGINDTSFYHYMLCFFRKYTDYRCNTYEYRPQG